VKEDCWAGGMKQLQSIRFENDRRFIVWLDEQFTDGTPIIGQNLFLPVCSPLFA
jgi:hypothetical protein